MISRIGENEFQDLYTGCRINDDGSVTVYVGPGDISELMDAIREADFTVPPVAGNPPIRNATMPVVHVERVQASRSQLHEVAVSFGTRQSEFRAAGFQASGSHPNPATGTFDIDLANTPEGGAEAATAYFQERLSPLARVVRVGVQMKLVETRRVAGRPRPQKGSASD